MISEPLPKVNKKSPKNLRLINVPTVQESKNQELFYIYSHNSILAISRWLLGIGSKKEKNRSSKSQKLIAKSFLLTIIMKKIFVLFVSTFVLLGHSFAQKKVVNIFSDGSVMSKCFSDSTKIPLN